MGRHPQHSAEFKESVIQECLRPGVSMAAVALAHALDATMARKWVTEVERKGGPVRAAPAAPPEMPIPSPSFAPLALPTTVAEGAIRIELPSGARLISSGRKARPVTAQPGCATGCDDPGGGRVACTERAVGGTERTPTTRIAPAAARSSGLARTLPKSWTTPPLCSKWRGKRACAACCTLV
jgi:transposase